jgi:hypothetical protein
LEAKLMLPTAPRAPLALALALVLAAPVALAGPEKAPPAQAAAAKSLSAPRGAALVAALKTKRLKRIEFKDITLKDLVAWLRVATGWNWAVNQVALAKADVDTAALTFSADFDDLSVATLLEVLLEAHGIALRVQDNIVWITSKADAQGRLVTRVYGISHITWTKVDFAAAEINLHPSDFTAQEFEPEKIVEDDPFNNGEAVAELLKEIVASGQWTNEGWEVRATNNHLVVRAPAAVHTAIPAALDTIASLK